MYKFFGIFLFLLKTFFVFSQVNTEQQDSSQTEVILYTESLNQNLEIERTELSKLQALIEQLQDSISDVQQKLDLAYKQMALLERKHKREQLQLQSKIKEHELQLLKLEYEYENAQEKARRHEQKIQVLELQIQSKELVIDMQNSEIERIRQQRTAAWISIGTVILLSVLGFWIYKKKKKVIEVSQHKEQQEQRQETTQRLEESKETLEESIFQQNFISQLQEQLQDIEQKLASEQRVRQRLQEELEKSNKILTETRQVLQLYQLQTRRIRNLLLPDLKEFQSLIGKCTIISQLPDEEFPHYFYQIVSPYEEMAVIGLATMEADALDKIFLMVLGQQIFKQVVAIEKITNVQEVIQEFYRSFFQISQKSNAHYTWKVNFFVACFDKKVRKIGIASVGLQVLWWNAEGWEFLPNSQEYRYAAKTNIKEYRFTVDKSSQFMVANIPVDELRKIAENPFPVLQTNQDVLLKVEKIYTT
ncbi:MAG: hypothetical protein NZM38_10720 [Cytophagales bacterium]|nr:hypothetical protein [Cytophagales bacterium]MDW8385226.1 hypothetical protein [Flammeovirgaceae bacterium]